VNWRAAALSALCLVLCSATPAGAATWKDAGLGTLPAGAEQPRLVSRADGSAVLVFNDHKILGTGAKQTGTGRVWLRSLPAGARATWGAPTLISKPGTGRPNVVRAAVGAGGLTVVAWTSRSKEASLFVRVRPAGAKGWLPITTLVARSVHSDALGLELVAGPAGEIHAVWTQSDHDAPCTEPDLPPTTTCEDETLHASTWDPAARRWSAPVLLLRDGASGGSETVNLAARPDGWLVVGDFGAVQADPGSIYMGQSRSPGVAGAWGPVGTIWHWRPAADGVTGFGPGRIRLAATSSGAVAAIWTFREGEATSEYVSVLGADGAWGPATVLEDPTRVDPAPEPQITTDAGDRMYLVQGVRASATSRALSVFASAPGLASWTSRPLGPVLSVTDAFRAATAPDGRTVIAYEKAPAGKGPFTSTLSVIVGNPVTGAFSAPVRLSAAADRTETENGVHTAGGYAGPALTITRHRAVVVWEEAGTLRSRVLALG